MVTTWSHAKGGNSGELSRAEFRDAVVQLGLSTVGSGSTSAASIDDVFAKYDEDGGGSLDADEAKAMVRGLLKLAVDCEHERVHKERRATKSRRVANKKVSLSQVPVEAMLTCSHTPTPSAEAAPAPKKKRLPIPPKMSSEAALRLSLGGLKAELVAMLTTERTRTKAAQQRVVQETMQKAAARLSHLSLAVSWTTWLSYNNETLHYQEILERASRVLMNPMKMKAFSKWADWYDERLGSLQTMGAAMRNMHMAAEIRFFNMWAKSVESNALICAAVDHSDRLAQLKLVSLFHKWRQLQLQAQLHRSLHDNQLCKALGIWIRAQLITLRSYCSK